MIRGTPLGGAVVDHDIDLEFDEGILLPRQLQAQHRGLLFLLLMESCKIFQNVFLDGGQVLPDPVRTVPALEVDQELFDDGDDDPVVQFLKGFLRLAFDIAHLAHDDIHLRFEFGLLGDQLGQLLPADFSGVRLGHQVFHADGISVQEKSDLRPGAGASLHLDNLESLILYLLLEIFEDGALPVLEMIEEALALFHVPPAFKDRRDTLLQLVEERFHVLLEGDSLSGRQAEHHGSIGVAEIIDVAFIHEGCRAGCVLAEHAGDRGRAPGAGDSGGKDVVPLVLHFQSHPQSPHGAILPDDLVQRLYVFHAADSELRWPAGPAECFGGDFERMRALFHGSLGKVKDYG